MNSNVVLVRKPANVVAVAIVPTNGATPDVSLTDALVDNDVAVVCISAECDFEQGLELARGEFGPFVPMMVAAVGDRVPAALKAARKADLTSAVIVDGPIGSGLRNATLPTLFMVDRAMTAKKFWYRFAAARSGSSFKIVDHSMTGAVRDFMLAPAVVTRDAVVSMKAFAPALAAAALVALPLMTTAAPSASSGRFAGGTRVSAAQIGGDSQAAAHSDAKADKAAKGASKLVPNSAISGDGDVAFAPSATGSVNLVAGNGAKFFVNTNITFATTSSASAAMSEASFTAPSATVTTSAGGVTNTELNDAFDGQNSLFVAPVGPLPSISTITYRGNGAAAADASADPTCTNRQYSFTPQTMQGLSVYRTIFVPTTGDYARHMNVLSNPTAAPITVTVGAGNNLGSDSNTRVFDSSNNDTVGTDLTDTWVGTFQNYSGTTSSDPREAHVIQGVNPPLAPAVVNFVDGDDNPTWNWSMTLQPGETASFMSFEVVETTKARAKTSAVDLAALTPSGDGTIPALACIDRALLPTLKNFAISLPDITVASVTVNETASVATLTFSRASSVDAATVTFSLADGTAMRPADFTDPASFTVNFAAGAATATVNIPIVDDTEVESDETFTATIESVTGWGRVASAPANSATVTIASEDVAPTTTVAPVATVPDTVAATTTIDPNALAPLPATGRQTGNAAGLAAAFLACGTALVGFARRRRTS